MPTNIPLKNGCESILLYPSTVITASVNGTAFEIPGAHKVIVVCEFTNKAAASGDKCNVYIDLLVGTVWINAIHFTEALGNGTDAATEYAVLDSTTPGTAIVVATADAASTAVRPAVFGEQIRVRNVVTDAGTASFTLAVTAFVVGF